MDWSQAALATSTAGVVEPLARFETEKVEAAGRIQGWYENLIKETDVRSGFLVRVMNLNQFRHIDGVRLTQGRRKIESSREEAVRVY